ncbi:glycosyltransferase [Ferroplasma sp.]|uniref:glycosyltransferase n=1 Tax=Ferroplasma sp. TaxID=2591003 RepID=UPI0026283B73|nr:glycosyltransferase [Ferroplasma sp.]
MLNNLHENNVFEEPYLLWNVSVIIPAYNERDRIKPVVDGICSFVMMHQLPWEIIVAVDGNDGTIGILNNMRKSYPFLITSKVAGRSGHGGAIKRGIAIAKGDYFVFMDADGAIDFTQILNAIPLLGNYDVVTFDRYKLKTNYIPRVRRFLSRGFNLYVRFLLHLNVNDTQGGYKLIRAREAKEIFSRLTITNAFFLAPLFYYVKSLGFNLKVVSVEYRHSEGSKFNVLDLVIGGFLTTLFFRIRHSFIYKFIPEKLKILYYRKLRWL